MWRHCSRSVTTRVTTSRGLSTTGKPRVLLQTPEIFVACLPVTGFQMNQFVFGCKKTGVAALVVSGDSDPSKWIEAAKEHDCNIEHLLQTHAHIDHVAGLADTKDRLPAAPVYLHPLDLPWLETMDQQVSMFGMEVRTDLPAPDVLLSDGDEITVGSLTAKVMHTPGHSPGHVCFYIEKEALVFGGDLLFQRSIGRTDFPMCDPAAMKASLALIMTLPDETVVFPGHNDPTTIGDERRHNPYV